MVTARDVANYLIYLMNDSCDDLSNMKINKLLYYAQGHSYQRTGHPLFADPIEAFDHGPVVFDVYQKYSGARNNAIKEYDKTCLENLTDDEKELLLDVAREYGKYTASALRIMTHKPGSPWDITYRYGAMHNVIPEEMIADYFMSKEPVLRSLEQSFSDDDYVGFRDEDGYLVLPREWSDEEV